MSNPPSVAVVGTGYWGRNLVRNFAELGALAAICDTNLDAARALAEQHHVPAVFRDVADVLGRDDIGAIVIATPAVTHEAIAIGALAAGKDVLVEKPLAVSAEGGEKLAALAEEKGRVLMVGHLLWYHPAVLRLKELIDEGRLGSVQYLYSNRLNLGKIRVEEDILWSFAPHDISVILGLVGETPDEVTTRGGAYLNHEVADVTVSLLRFPSGVRAHIYVSWLHPFKEQRLVVVGDRGMAVFSDTADDKLVVYPHRIRWDESLPVPERADGEAIPVSDAEPLRAECEHFLGCVRSREVPRTDAAEGARVLHVLERCQQSLRGEGHP